MQKPPVNLDKVIEFAQKAHKDQKRKYTGEPYFNHVKEVAEIVRAYGGSDEMIAAAYLHDTIEDCDVTRKQLQDLFGIEITNLVVELTDQATKEMGNRKARKAWETDRLSRVSPEAQTVKLADLISNTASISKHDPDFAKVYLAEKRALLKVMVCGNMELYKRAMEQIGEEV